MKLGMLSACAVLALAATAGSAAAATLTFDNPGDVAGWTVDRYAPAGFDSGVMFGGDERLRLTLSETDSAANRPPAFSAAFYNTQGRSTVIPGGPVTHMSIDFFVDDAFSNLDQRIGGLWGVGVNGANAITAYPIIEYTTDSGSDRFQVWNGNANAWVNLTAGDPVVDFDAWYRLDITLSGGDWLYNVTNLANVSQTWNASVGANGSVGMRDVIVQGYNNGVSNTLYFDNLTTGAVPEPGAWALMILGFGAAGAMVRRRRAAFA